MCGYGVHVRSEAIERHFEMHQDAGLYLFGSGTYISPSSLKYFEMLLNAGTLFGIRNTLLLSRFPGFGTQEFRVQSVVRILL